MPQLDLVFYFIGALSTGVSFNFLLFWNDGLIIPKLGEGLKVRHLLNQLPSVFKTELDKFSIVSKEDYTQEDLNETVVAHKSHSLNVIV